jgi:hypothetical protein
VSVRQIDLTEDEFHRFNPDDAATWPTRLVLRAILEAVRALKPERPALSLHDPDFYAKLHERMKPAISATEVDAWQTVERLRAELADARTAESVAHRVVEVQEAELKRFRELYDEALMPVVRWIDNYRVQLPDVGVLNQAIAAVRDFKIETKPPTNAELQRFRDREELVKDLVDAVITCDHIDDECEDCAATYGAAAAVRDFKVQP